MNARKVKTAISCRRKKRDRQLDNESDFFLELAVLCPSWDLVILQTSDSQLSPQTRGQIYEHAGYLWRHAHTRGCHWLGRIANDCLLSSIVTPPPRRSTSLTNVPTAGVLGKTFCLLVPMTVPHQQITSYIYNQYNIHAHMLTCPRRCSRVSRNADDPPHPPMASCATNAFGIIRSAFKTLLSSKRKGSKATRGF